ncbi:hypothetical protein [Medusavirus stheno T3]|uniref:Uncharacterized protein n=1 Tax=Medusavirus stheno T3 TaxID=3069717 RepID=A0A7S7YEB7_9VIRU|nr:hypothetical protein QKU73_gp027 [Acanthamoeba castellanii medusavirus]QPB44208.1 hypothetical protein [Medusavirus stheno T3]
MQELLAREEAHNRRLLKPLLDAVWSDEGARKHYHVTAESCIEFTNNMGWCQGVAMTPVTREWMERRLLTCMRHGECIRAVGRDLSSNVFIDEGASYVMAAIQALNQGNEDQPTTARSFLVWEEEAALWTGILAKRMGESRSTALMHISDKLRCATCWLRRIYACEAMRTHVLFPAQLEIAQDVYPLEKKD